MLHLIISWILDLAGLLDGTGEIFPLALYLCVAIRDDITAVCVLLKDQKISEAPERGVDLTFCIREVTRIEDHSVAIFLTKIYDIGYVLVSLEESNYVIVCGDNLSEACVIIIIEAEVMVYKIEIASGISIKLLLQICSIHGRDEVCSA